jgi:hypothetical protein
MSHPVDSFDLWLFAFFSRFRYFFGVDDVIAWQRVLCPFLYNLEEHAQVTAPMFGEARQHFGFRHGKFFKALLDSRIYFRFFQQLMPD